MTNADYHFLKGGDEMGELIRSIDWSKTPIGPVDQWPQSLRLATSIMLSTPFPMYIAWGKEYIQLYNDGYRPILGSTKHPQAMGISTRETFAEIWHIIASMFDGVMEGTAVGFPNFMLPLDRNGYVEECFFDFSYSPIYNDDETVGGVLVTVIETTENLKNIQKLKESNVALKRSEENLRNLISHAPVAMAVFRGPDYVIEIVNQKVLELWGKTYEQVINKPVFEGLPEVIGQGIDVLLSNVFSTGERFIANELPVNLFRNGELQLVYLNFVYEALKDSDDKIYGIAAVAVEVTEQVNARQNVEEAEERARLAIEAAKIGTFDYNFLDDTVVTSPRFDEIMGIDNTSDHSQYLAAIHPQDLMVRDKAFEKAYNTGQLFYKARVEKGNETRWVQAEGKVYYDDENKPSRLLGTLLDITEQKSDEMRKNDFIGMVSHELKTPLTSLTAIIQLANAKLKISDDSFLSGAMEKANTQVKKMTAMINGFLNISRLESSKIQIDRQEINLEHLLEETISEIELTVSSHEIHFEPCNPIMVSADNDKISSVISNLISNAVKYSPKGKVIEVKCLVVDNNAQVSVRDEGMGIDEADIDKLFERYYRVESDHTRNISGFGIGLYLSAEIIQRHDGKIWAESEIGKGSTFYFSLPLTRD
ncbi:PAS domain-containing sensor histidine kinase [Mucilaginibacter gilvus]|uniref:histidine kinase n=1 Tax=Mucilaginibacter gilvus TaxID=2305909 RepID=A0A3S3VDS4_9SPHI|nr:ATP-binding protein [Mucilaginibacter gilvus]RWY51260.1 PAS domain S-box protein [Mucilaginibacter gilvus]